MLGQLLQGFAMIFASPSLVLVLVLGVGAGIMVGGLPGLTATMGVALLVPLTFGMPPVAALLMLVGVYVGAIYGGSVSAILLRTPGTPAAAATILDGFALAQQGKAGKALSTSTIASFIGGIVSALALTFIAPQLANFALRFSSPEYFALALLGLTVIASISGDSVVKGLIAGMFGLLLSLMGMDPLTGYARFTFDNINLLNGVSFVPVLIGLFAVSEALASVEQILQKTKVDFRFATQLLSWKEIRGISWTSVKSAVMGTMIGIMPGAGADIAAFVAYGEAKRSSKHPEKFGTGVLEGIAAPEAGNNGVTGGSMVPLLTLGIPGDATTAVMLGAFMMLGLRPGPMLFKENGDIVYAVFAGFLIANVLMLLYGLFGIKFFARILTVPRVLLTPIIFFLCVVGSYAINNSMFDVWVMMVFGLIGYLMQKLKFPLSPIVLALILGPMAEGEFRRALMMSQGNLSIFITRPISAILLAVVVISIVQTVVKQRKARLARLAAAAE